MNKMQEVKEGAMTIIESVCEEVCDKLCKFRGTCDDDMVCNYIRENEQCPLDRLY